MSDELEDPKDFVYRQGFECKTYVLTSTPDCHIPSALRYLLHLYRTGNEKIRESAVDKLRSWDASLPEEIILAVLSGKLPYEEFGGNVTIKHANF